MSLIVQKFGGSSVADKERVFNVAKRIIETYKKGNSVVVVVSAQGDTTDDLIEKAAEISKNPSKREMDMLLSTGEQISISLLAMAIHELGYPAISLTGWQVGLTTDTSYSNARISKISADRIKKELEHKNIVVVAGFQGINKYEDITTLGRGGSDTSAVALAAALGADLCEIYTDVDGVYTADPRIVKNAKKMDVISFDEMLELASMGANVLHNRSVEMAKKYNVNLCVRSSLNNNEGTVVKEVNNMEKMLVKGVAHDLDVARISLCDIEDKPGVAFKVFSLLAKNGINVDIILQSIGRENKKDISFTVSKSNMQKAVELLCANKEVIGFEDLKAADSFAKVSIVGAGMVNNPGVASSMFEALCEAGINIHMISTSEIKVSVLISEKNAEKAVNAICDKFNLAE
ncbi:aspartate kinase [Qingrenia yutianensis]|uniref:Aspartokinase n=1 Tax=Qingrenia yutianensis TaxID=2763676 RepID=A0A926FE89_9FIRM|nr:aspartate kinase [Qingrenia yutianensis]MBC8596650.1 aspartate kinase [Qingrenia yutianensis]